MPLILIVVFGVIFGLASLTILAVSRPKTSKQMEATVASALGSFTLPGRDAMVDVRKEHRLSSIPWLHKLLSRINFSKDLRLLLIQADLPWTTGKLMLISAAAWIGSGYLIALRLHSAVLGVLLGLAVGAMPLIYVSWKRRKRLRVIQQQLPQTLDLMVSALRAGHSMGNALGAAAREAPEPTGREFRLCFEEQNFGINLRTATSNLLERVPLQDLRIVTTALLIHRESGGNLAEVLDKTGQVIRDRFRLRQQIRVHTAQGRLTGGVLISMPVILGIFLYLTNPEYIGLLFSRALGHKMMAGAIVMNVIGLLIVRKIVNIRV
jgi:tight adherence protein B